MPLSPYLDQIDDLGLGIYIGIRDYTIFSFLINNLLLLQIYKERTIINLRIALS